MSIDLLKQCCLTLPMLTSEGHYMANRKKTLLFMPAPAIHKTSLSR